MVYLLRAQTSNPVNEAQAHTLALRLLGQWGPLEINGFAALTVRGGGSAVAFVLKEKKD